MGWRASQGLEGPRWLWILHRRQGELCSERKVGVLGLAGILGRVCGCPYFTAHPTPVSLPTEYCFSVVPVCRTTVGDSSPITLHHKRDRPLSGSMEQEERDTLAGVPGICPNLARAEIWASLWKLFSAKKGEQEAIEWHWDSSPSVAGEPGLQEGLLASTHWSWAQRTDDFQVTPPRLWVHRKNEPWPSRASDQPC